MDYTMLKKQEPMSYAVATAANIADALSTNNYVNSDYLCENPWSVKGIEAKPWIEVGKDSLSEIVREAIREAIQEENALVTPKIEKYHIKHR